MRPIVLLLLALFGFVAVLAKKDDVACVVHSDDCGKCVSHGCNWCSDGYCVSAESDICEASKVATTCEAKILDKHQARQATADCESHTTCTACAQASGCQVCVDEDTQLFKCSSNAACTTTGYALAYEWWIPATGLKGLSFKAASVCPTPANISPTAPEIVLILSVYLYGTEASCNGLHTSFPIGKILALLQGILSSQQYDATFISITKCSVAASKRQTLLPDLYNANLIAKLGDNGAISGQGVAATVIGADPTITAAPGTTITVTPYLPGSGTSGQAIGSGSSGSKNNNTSLSKGALAGIIIGCIVFGAILVALIVWLVLRKRDSYPQAFRSPAAAYRP